jgi:hypothetical protein
MAQPLLTEADLAAIARESVIDFLDHHELTIDQWRAATADDSGASDDIKTRFAQVVLDEGPRQNELAPEVLAPHVDSEDPAWWAWVDAVDAAEDAL